MITEQQVKLAQLLLSTGVVGEVFHSAILYADESGDKFPVYAKGAEQYYIGPDDKKGRFAYIRQTGPVMKGNEVLEGSEKKMYLLSSANRIVVFKDRETENVDSLVRKLLKPCFSDFVSLSSYQHNAFQLEKQESPIAKFAFDATTFYLAIDVIIRWWASEEDCEEPCITYPNPICL